VGLPDPAAPLVGKLLDDRYELLEVIGEGGVGTVYRARRVNLERMVAVKVLHEWLVEEAGLVGRFQREATAMSRLYHPHCVQVIDSGVYESRPYLVLEYLPGQTIRQLLSQGPLTPRRAVQITLQLLETLEYFHGHHVIHRDLKSENVMLVESGGSRDFVKVLDFGMAKILTGPGSDSQLSKIGIVPGTPSAMAPEQIYQLPPDPRIDIYATGILLYEMVVGTRPFTGTDMATVVRMQLSTPAKPPREVIGEDGLSAELEQVILRALEKDRVDRFGTASEMATALKRTPEGRAARNTIGDTQRPGSLTAAATATVTTATKRPHVAVLGGVVALVVAAAAFFLWPSKSVAPATTTSAAQVPPTPVPVAAAPAPEPEVELPPARPPQWLTHRDEAVKAATAGQRDVAYREIEAALKDDAIAASADAALAVAAVTAMDHKQIGFVVETFRTNPQLSAALATATAEGEAAEQRHAALDALKVLGQESSADLTAMRILDVKQSTTCVAMRDAMKQLQAQGKDARIAAFKAEVRAHGKRDPQVRCLKKMLRR
jgi:eukaryotic-like serine/threonine-protein kinase